MFELTEEILNNLDEQHVDRTNKQLLDKDKLSAMVLKLKLGDLFWK